MSELTLGQKIRNFRIRAKMSQLDLETEIGAASGSISRIEVGKVNPDKETLIKIVDILKVRAHEAVSLLNLDINSLTKWIEIAQKLSSILDLDSVLQSSVNEVSDELDLNGSAIFLIEGDTVYSKTFNQSGKTKHVLEMVGRPFGGLTASLSKDKDNLVVKTIIDQKVHLGHKINHFMVPFLTPEVTESIVRFVGTKSMICFPLTSGTESIGAIFFARNYIDNFELEFPVLQSFSKHIATAVSNAQKFESLGAQIKT